MQKNILTFLLSHAITLLCIQWSEAYVVVLLWILCVCTGCSIIIHYIFQKTYLAYTSILFGGAMCAIVSVLLLHVQEQKDITTIRECFVEACTITGRISAEPDRRPMQTKYTIAVSHITNELLQIDTKTSGKILVTDSRKWPRFEYGDTVTAYGTLKIPETIQDTFSYDNYLRRFGIFAIITQGSIYKTETQTYYITDKIWRTLFTIKTIFEEQINKQFAEPHASFLAGILTGSRRGIPSNVLNDFQTTGLTHIIAISGFNITIIIVLMNQVLQFLPKRFRLIPSVIAIFTFTIFVGASAAVVRAAIMGILGLLALHSNYKSTAIVTVLWTHFFMTMYNPTLQWYDAGFQLSFLSVIGLILIVPIFTPFTTWLPNTLAIRESFTMTMSAQIMTAPLIIISFQRFSIIAPIANILIAPFIPLAMLLGFVGTVISFVFFPLGQLINYYTWFCLESVIQIATWLAQVPYASINITAATWVSGGLYYVGIICLVWYYYKKTAVKGE